MNLKSILLFIICALLLFEFSRDIKAQANITPARDSVLSRMLKYGVTGIAVCKINENKIIWNECFGWGDAEKKISVNPQTLFMLASVSKTITGASLMHLLDKGLFKLDDDINKYLSFVIRNPKHPDTPITFRMLLNHSSSFSDNRKYIDSLYVYGDSKEPGLEDLFKQFYDKAGKYYSDMNFSAGRPGEKYLYSNLNYVLIAALVERISGKSFSAYCRENLFVPLEMKETAWFIKDLNPDNMAFNYVADSRTETKRRKIEHYGWPGYADGCLRTSIEQYSNFLLMLLNKGKFKNHQILSPQAVSEMFSLQDVDIKGVPKGKVDLSGIGLTWHYLKLPSAGYFYHTGGGTGITTFAFIDPINGNGGAAFITGTLSRENGNKILDLLIK